MRIKTLAAATLITVSCAGLVACSDDEPSALDGDNTPVLPPPAQSVQPSTPGTEGLPHSGAPKVETPIADTSGWEADPCTLVTAQQLSSLGLSATTPEREDLPNIGPGCFWEFDPETVSGFSVSFASQGEGKGLSNLYLFKEKGATKVFEELPPVEGFPAVVIMLNEDKRSEGSCSVAVGVRDDLTVGVDLAADPSIEQGKDPCGSAAEIAALAVQTMKGGS